MNKESTLIKKSNVDAKKLFDDSDSSEGELFKPLPAIKRIENSANLESEAESTSPRKPGGLISNVKINSSILSSSGVGGGSDSDDGLFGNSQATAPVPRKTVIPVTSLLADSDDDGKIIS